MVNLTGKGGRGQSTFQVLIYFLSQNFCKRFWKQGYKNALKLGPLSIAYIEIN